MGPLNFRWKPLRSLLPSFIGTLNNTSQRQDAFSFRSSCCLEFESKVMYCVSQTLLIFLQKICLRRSKLEIHASSRKTMLKTKKFRRKKSFLLLQLGLPPLSSDFRSTCSDQQFIKLFSFCNFSIELRLSLVGIFLSTPNILPFKCLDYPAGLHY